MAKIESPEFCTIGEYRRDKNQRIGFPNVEKGKLYTLMAKIVEPEREAVRATTLLVARTAVDMSVSLLFYDRARQEISQKGFRFDADDYLHPDVATISVVDHRYDQQRWHIADCYLKNWSIRSPNEKFAQSAELKPADVA